MDTAETDIADRIDDEITAETARIPALPPGAPTLARHLHWALDFIAGAGFSSVGGHRFDEALAALEALPQVPPGTERLGDKIMWREEDGCFTPAALVKPGKLLEDSFVRTVAGGALSLSTSLTRFKALAFSEAQALLDTLAQDYGVQLGGKVGNVSFFTYDRGFRVEVQVQKRMTVGPTIELAKAALNDYLAEAQASDEVKAIITSAFGIDDQGRVRVAELVRLRRLNITHPKWIGAMKAIDDAMDTAGKAIYLRVKRRTADGRYELIPLDLASA